MTISSQLCLHNQTAERSTEFSQLLCHIQKLPGFYFQLICLAGGTKGAPGLNLAVSVRAHLKN